tara:strand:- start:862496 stop:864397 length:1902 start_codon:yes stop_codon:yes gene_type:complete
MAYSSNPFLERMSERTASDQDFVQLFSPKILEKLPENAIQGGVHIFRSAPGAGKTTLFRAFTPLALRAFWNLRRQSEHSESFQHLVAHGVLSNDDNPSFIGVVLSCAAGYADLPPSDNLQEGMFRALLDCRVVLRTLRSLTLLLGVGASELENIEVIYDSGVGTVLRHIPQRGNAKELIDWAEQYEQHVYAQLDTFVSNFDSAPHHERFESVLWLQSVKFMYQGNVVAPKRMLMVDDVQRLRRKQRNLLIDELIVLRPNFPIWLAERTVALGDDILSQGGRDGRDINQIDLDCMWTTKQFVSYAQNILDRRMSYQDVVASRSFGNCLRGELTSATLKKECAAGAAIFKQWVEQHKSNVRYSEWISEAEKKLAEPNLDNILDLYLTRILLIRDGAKKQMSLDLALPAEEIEERDTSQVRAAAELFMHEELKIPYYFGLERLCVLASNNVEELLFLAATLYEGLQAMQILRKPEVIMGPDEQEKLLKNAAQRKWDFIPKNHTDGRRAQRLIESIAILCKEKTYLPNAPYAPGVTGVRLSKDELNKITSKDRLLGEPGARLARVLAECAAENLVLPRESQASTNRDSGTVFYLNRTLCAQFDLPLQLGGWQDVSAGDMIKWMERRMTPSQLTILES